MTPRMRKLFIIEIISLILSLAPLLIMWYASSLEETVSEDLLFFVIGMNIYIVYPLLSVVVSVILAFCGFENFFCAMPAPIAFILSTFYLLPVSIVDAALGAIIYALIGLGLSTLIIRLRRRSEENKRVLGR